MKPDGLLIKLMMLTTSDNDGEALTALRKANKILAAAKVNWAELLGDRKVDNSFRVPPSKRADPPSSPRPRPRPPEPKWESFGDDERFTGPEINEYFDKIARRKNLTEGFGAFIESVHTWWDVRGYLTKKQYDTIRKTAERD